MKIGIAGLGFMGMVHYLTYQKIRGAEVVAVSDPQKHRLAGDWTDIQGNFGPTGTQMDLENLARFSDVREMIQNAEIDMLDICLPPSQHAEVAQLGLARGLHVFCEKPIALKSSDADAMVAAAEKAKRQLFIGHVLPFFPEYAYARNQIEKGTYGKLLGGNFLRVTSEPAWLPQYWNPEVTGGPMLDLHIHDAHFIRLIFGMPKQVFTTGRLRGEMPAYFQSSFQFSDPNVFATATSGTIPQQGRPFMHGYEMHFEQATLQFQFAVVDGNPETLMPLTVFLADGSVERPSLPGGDPMLAFEAELSSVLESAQAGKPSPILDGSLARDALLLAEKQTLSLRTHGSVDC